MSAASPRSGLPVICSPTRLTVLIALLAAAIPAWLIGVMPDAAHAMTAQAGAVQRVAAPATRPTAKNVLVTAHAQVHRAAGKRLRLAVLARAGHGHSYTLLVRFKPSGRASMAIARTGAHGTKLSHYRPIPGTVKSRVLSLRLRVTGTSPVRVTGTVARGGRYVSVTRLDRSRRRIGTAGTTGVWPRSGTAGARTVSWTDLRSLTIKTATAATASSKPAAVTGRPYLSKQTQAWKEYAAESNPTLKRMYYNIASTPTATWLNGTSADASNAKSIVDSATRAGQVAQFVLYGLPGRDCGGYSAGGASSDAAYRSWVSSIAAAIGSRRAIAILEPDAISFCNNNASVRAERTALLTYAAKTLHDKAPKTATYLHAGSGQLSYSYTVSALRDSGIRYMRGFAMNVSSINGTSAEIAYGNALVAKLKAAGLPGKRYVVDTSRNGAGAQPNPGAAYSSCNNMNAALGSRPTTHTASSYADAYLWVKPPGSSDGTCHSGDPSAGQWFPAMAQALVDNAVKRKALAYETLP